MCFLPSVNLHHLADAGTDAMTRVSGPSFRMHALRLMLPPPHTLLPGRLERLDEPPHVLQLSTAALSPP